MPKRFHSGWLLLVAGFFAAAVSNVWASDLSSFVGKRVVSVDVSVEGAPGATVRQMRDLLDVETGQEYSPVRIRDSLSRLHDSGLVSGAVVEGEAVGGDGVALRFVVKPQARIETVKFEGDIALPVADLRARLNELHAGDKLSGGAVAEGVGDLLPVYSANGYFQANITSDVELDDTGTRATVIYTISPGEPSRISRYTLDIRGHRLDFSKIKHTLAEGQRFTQAAVDAEIALLKKTYSEQNYFAAALTSNVAADLIDNSVAVTISGTSGPHVTVDIQGLELDEKDKREVLPFYSRGGGIDDFSLEEGRRRLEDYAQKQGYFFAEVTGPATPSLAADSVRIDYRVEQGNRYKLSAIHIEGLEAIPDEEIESQLKSKVASFIPLFGLHRGVTSNELLRTDSNLISRRLRDLGYRNSHVDVRRGVSLSGEDLIITFDVREGLRTYVEDVAVRGNYVVTTEEARRLFVSQPGRPLLANEVSRSVDELSAAYSAAGYASAEVVAELVDLGTAEDRDRVRLVFNVAEGSRVRIRDVITRGAALTDPGRLERDFYLFKEGEWLRNERLQETERALYETNAFNSVTITSDVVGKTPDGVEERDVNVDLLEAKRLLLIYGVGYQSSKGDLRIPGLRFLNGARGLVQLTNTNMFGKLYTGSAQLRVGRDELLGQLSFQNPRPLGFNYPTLISVLGRRLAEKTFRTDRYTALLQTERRLSPETIVYMSYNFERVSIIDPQVTLSEFERNRRTVTLGRIGPSFLRDTRDNFTDPKRGTLSLGSFNIATRFLGGNVDFVKLLIEHSRNYSVSRFRDTVFSVSGRLGLAIPFSQTEVIPISERFFGGGSRDLRGFGFEEAGPRDPATGGPVGGNAVIVINNELRFPIWKTLGGAAFVDIGNVFPKVSFPAREFTGTAGFGLRIKTPVGPVRFDIGFLVLNRPAGVPSFRRHFSLGQTF